MNLVTQLKIKPYKLDNYLKNNFKIIEIKWLRDFEIKIIEKFKINNFKIINL